MEEVFHKGDKVGLLVAFDRLLELVEKRSTRPHPQNQIFLIFQMATFFFEPDDEIIIGHITERPRGIRLTWIPTSASAESSI